jgi:pimeloyl-ACP methyl ester carboxylesterase
MQYLSVLGAHIEYVRIDPTADDAPTLVFLHEGLGCVEMWRDFPRDLANATGCGALVYSRAGYGGSSPVAIAPRSIRYLYDEAEIGLPALLKALSIERCILVGHSDGASIALIHAATKNASGRVKAVIVEAPHCFVEDISVTSIERIKVAFETTDLREKLARRHGTNVDCAFWGWNGMWLDPAFRSFDIEHLLPAVGIPVLAIQGVDDEYGTLRQLDALVRGCSGPVERLVLDACGHSPHRDQRDETLRAMTQFILAIQA